MEQATRGFEISNTTIRNKQYTGRVALIYDMSDETEGGIVNKGVAIRDCYIVLMMDNLVSLNTMMTLKEERIEQNN